MLQPPGNSGAGIVSDLQLDHENKLQADLLLFPQCLAAQVCNQYLAFCRLN